MNTALPAGELFELFVLQQQQWAMVSLGKIQHPLTGDVGRDLDQARFSIDLLAMLEDKTRGNLSDRETRLLSQVLTNLRLNFVEEASRPVSPDGAGPDPTTGPTTTPGMASALGETE